MNHNDYTIAVVGLGYVGLPLALEFSKKFKVIGFDINESRIKELKEGKDRTKEVSSEELRSAGDVVFTSRESDIAFANFYILALPTPVNEFNVPDFGPLIAASKSTGKFLEKGNIVVYESTVYPGATREICIPALEEVSGLVCDKDFFVGYSPERISPADNNKARDIVKITSGSTEGAAKIVDEVYKEIITAGTCPVSSLEVAEACKVIENAQRDVNIAFMNEIAVLLNKLNIDTKEVVDAMQTKWNALRFVPGLVGGHCIGVDPYYLAHKAQAVGHNMGILRAARNINDSMGFFIANEIILLTARKKIFTAGARALLMGITFKEDCPDIRNAKPLDIKAALETFGVSVDVFDPVVDAEDVKKEFDINMVEQPQKGDYDIIVLSVMHNAFKKMGSDTIHAFGKEKHVFYDVKSVFAKNESDGRL
jgi:UDP-N-acetyl-D-galactosamine dehydrogenase